MAAMSRAIRETIEQYAPTLSELDSDTLREFVAIVGAFYADLQRELDSR